ncbi:aminoglycoside phosphotransferase family protein [Nocardia sp. NPDC005825]|uniref:aminoglycoside phosphotransferase family protein n=1 Tax=unclassified Nocardia TaxID=2637762 RepID=UPI0033E6D72B
MSFETVADSSEAILHAACARAGVRSDGAVVLNRSENVIYKLPGGIVARVARAGQQAAARREVEVSRWLESARMSAVRVVPEIEQPVVVDERAVTFWVELPPHHHGTPIQVAGALRKLHALAPPLDLHFGTLDPFVRLDKRIEGATTISADDRAWMREHLAELKERWSQLPAGLPWCVVHGDAWVGNVVGTDSGETILLDLERTSIGPPEWDTVHTAIKFKTLGQISAREYDAFCDVYGHDVTTWAGYVLLRDLREFRMTSMATQTAVTIPADRAQADHRIACLRGKFGPRPWAGWRPVPSQ